MSSRLVFTQAWGSPEEEPTEELRGEGPKVPLDVVYVTPEQVVFICLLGALQESAVPWTGCLLFGKGSNSKQVCVE